MLAAIGLTLILKEVPHIVGYDKDYFGDESFFQIDGYNTFSDILNALNAFSPGAFIIGLISVVLLLIFEKTYFKKNPFFKIIPGALIVVIIGIILNTLFQSYLPKFALSSDHLVNLQIITSFSDIGSIFTFPNFNEVTNPKIYIFALTIALIASLETLLSLEATDKLDPNKHYTPTNKELKAQGLGNIVSGLLGGLPVTQVIVRSSANINAGAKSKLSTILHGILLLISAFIFPSIINLIPLSALAAILMLVGYKLSNIHLYKDMYRLGSEQFIPFITTIISVLLTDLLKGIAIGMGISIFYILRKNYRNNYEKTEISDANGIIITVKLSEEVSFLNKGSIIEILQKTKSNSRLIIDGSKSKNIDYDVLEVIYEFRNNLAIERNISIELINIPVLTY
jgi:carbonic anhydrase